MMAAAFLLAGILSQAPQPQPQPWQAPRYHWASKLDRNQGDPTAPIKIGNIWHVFVDGCGGWCHGVSSDGGASWVESTGLRLQSGIGTGSWGMLPNGTAVGLYCSAACKELTCIGVLTSDDPLLKSFTDHGIRFRIPPNYTGFRDPARAFVDAENGRLCTILGAGAHDCDSGGNKWLLFCTGSLENVLRWELVSTVASEFAKPFTPSGGEVQRTNDGCNGLVSCPDFFPISTEKAGERDDGGFWMLLGSYNTERSAWFPPSRYTIGTWRDGQYTVVSGGVLGGDYDFVPKSGADESNTGRRYLWSNVGVRLNGHTGYLSLAREMSVDASSAPPALIVRFIPELARLRVPGSMSRLAGPVPTTASRCATDAAGTRWQRVGDTVLLPAVGSHQMEVRLRVTGLASSSVGWSDGYGVSVLTSVAKDGTGLNESTRIGYSPYGRSVFIDRTYSSSLGPDSGYPPGDDVKAHRLNSYPFTLLGDVLELAVYVDGALIEVGVNNQTVFASEALANLEGSTMVGAFGFPAGTPIELTAFDLVCSESVKSS